MDKNANKKQISTKPKSVKEIVLKLYASNSGRWLLAFLVCILCIGVVVITRPVFFYLHDTNMMKTYSGYRTGIPTAEHTYGNMFIGYLMYGLYSLSMAVPWYTILTLGVLFFSIVIICRCIFAVAYKKNLAIRWPLCLFILLFIIAFYYQVAVILYTVNAAIVCCAAIALIFAAFHENSSRIQTADFVLSCIWILLGSFIRYSSYVASACFWVLALIMCILSKIFIHKRQQKKTEKSAEGERATSFDQTNSLKIGYRRFVVYILTLIMVMVSAKGLNLLGGQLRKNAFPEGFYELNKYRAKFMDYNTIPYNEAPEFFGKIGWSEVFYDLVKKNYFMDSKYNSENLKSIYEYSVQEDATRNDIRAIWELGCDTGVLTNVGLSLTCAIGAAFVMLLIILLTRRRRLDILPSFLCGGFAFGGCLILCVYLCWQGRFPLRAYQTVAFPTLVTMAFSILLMLSFEKKTKSGDNVLQNETGKHPVILSITHYILTAVMSLALVMSFVSSMQASYDKAEINRYTRDNMRYGAMVRYAQSHKENIYIHDITISGDERIYINSSKENAVNLILWGGTNVYTDSYNKQLISLGKEQLLTENLFDEDVYYMTGDGDEYMYTLWEYLTEEYGEVSFTQVDYLEEGVRVFKISKKTDSPIYNFYG